MYKGAEYKFSLFSFCYQRRLLYWRSIVGIWIKPKPIFTCPLDKTDGKLCFECIPSTYVILVFKRQCLSFRYSAKSGDKNMLSTKARKYIEPSVCHLQVKVKGCLSLCSLMVFRYYLWICQRHSMAYVAILANLVQGDFLY